MKKSFKGAAAIVVLFIASTAYCGGIPVFDAANLNQNVQSSLEQIAKLVQQIQELQRQYRQLEQTYASMTGGRGLGTILNDASNKNYLPDDWKGVYDGIRSGGYAGLSSSGRTVLETNRLYDVCALMTGQQRNVCERIIALAAQNRAYSGDAYEKAKGRLAQIEGLMRETSISQDQKAILELNARLQAENAMIQNEQIKLQMYKMVAESEQRLAEQQQREIELKKYSKRGGVPLDPKGIDINGE